MKLSACGPGLECIAHQHELHESYQRGALNGQNLRTRLHVHATIIVQQLWGDPDPILLNEPHGLSPILRGGVGYDDDRRGGREHLVGELVIG